MIAFKKIKPSRLKSKGARFKFLNGMRKTATQIRKDFAKTTATWKHDVEFTQVVSLAGPGPELLVATDDKIYGYVNDGTKPHQIWAGVYTGKSNKKVLSFQGSYKAKTKPGVIGSSAGGSSGDWMHRPYVNHPGTEARNFDEIIQKKWEPRFKAEMQAIMIEVRKESGHAI